VPVTAPPRRNFEPRIRGVGRLFFATDYLRLEGNSSMTSGSGNFEDANGFRF
jgi:hypothetical protein